MTFVSRLKIWLNASRLHTLPLSVSGILMGNLIALMVEQFNVIIFILSLLTAIMLQVLSNLANDYGDFLHGTDSEKRIGPVRTVQSGAISSAAMKKAVILFVILSFVAGTVLLAISFKNTGLIPAFIFLAVGLAAIWATWHYTASKKPYGYKGYGDLFVFIFFGLVAVAGPYYLQTGELSLMILFPAAAIGCFATAVLNLNNMRDIENDRESGKITLAVVLGIRAAKIYHLLLLCSGTLLMIYFSFEIFSFNALILLELPLLLFPLNGIIVLHSKPENFYSLLKQLSLSVLVYVLFFGLHLILY